MFTTNDPHTKKLGKDLLTLTCPHHEHQLNILIRHIHRYLNSMVPSAPSNCSPSPDTPYWWQPDKLGLHTPGFNGGPQQLYSTHSDPSSPPH